MLRHKQGGKRKTYHLTLCSTAMNNSRCMWVRIPLGSGHNFGGTMKLKELPKHMSTKIWIDSEIRYEKADGVHTYHNCKCGRDSCRSVMCAECWREAGAELNG